jgi:predicted nucleic acid-binding protein
MRRRTNSSLQAQNGVSRIATDALFHLIDLDRDLIVAAADIAIDLRLRGANAVYVALARRLDLPLVTWDREQRERAGRIIDVLTPAEALERMT